MAILEVLNEGPDKGKRLEVHGPLTNIGRGAHNDLVIANESVSDSHAKLQKRETGWFIVDIDTTNGTYVGGRRVQGAQMLTGAPDLRFGDVKVSFRLGAEPADTGKHTRAIVGVSVEELKRAGRSRAAADPVRADVRGSVAEATPSGGTTGGAPAWLWVLLLLVVGGIAAAVFLRGS